MRRTVFDRSNVSTQRGVGFDDRKVDGIPVSEQAYTLIMSGVGTGEGL
jgi:hypothetical protein